MTQSVMSIRLGTNDTVKAAAFYDATFAALGWEGLRREANGSLFYSLPGGPVFIIAPPRDGQAATSGNGTTYGFNAPDAAAVDRWHAAALALGGSCEGPPGPRPMAGGRYGAYLRDPDGNKFCAYAPAGG